MCFIALRRGTSTQHMLLINGTLPDPTILGAVAVPFNPPEALREDPRGEDRLHGPSSISVNEPEMIAAIFAYYFQTDRLPPPVLKSYQNFRGRIIYSVEQIAFHSKRQVL